MKWIVNPEDIVQGFLCHTLCFIVWCEPAERFCPRYVTPCTENTCTTYTMSCSTLSYPRHP